MPQDSSVGRRHRQRRLRALAVSGAGALVLVVAATATVGLGTGRSEEPTVDPRAYQTVAVTRGDLVEYRVLDGEVGYGVPVPVRCELTGTVTWIAPGGTVVGRGKELLRVDDEPVVLLYGQLPMFRPLAEATTGRDVEQFERNLRELGYTGFTVDDTYTDATAQAVRRWQDDLGRDETGRVELGEVLYAPAEVRIASHSLRVGAPVPADVLTWTGTTRVITTEVEPADAGWATPGAEVTVTLLDGQSMPASVARAGDVTSGAGPVGDAAAGDAAARHSVTVTVPDHELLVAVDAGTVEVRRVVRERRDVLTVPVSALLALAEGGYGLEVVDGESVEIVVVEAGMFADGRVEVAGTGVAAGMTVRIPQ
ncbi:peptidoglycan-binding protein [Micromonospora sp. LOL_023]|uniref:peptidoglycan-binding protein n=1 Tax=Micromonospora sp. LOL_023 TaxID=3345418 RepID=UPI003A8C2910